MLSALGVPFTRKQITISRFVRKAVAVTTTDGVPTLFQMMRREALKKK